jgi:plastocyanin
MLAILLTACSSPGSLLTPPPAAPTAATAVVGAGTRSFGSNPLPTGFSFSPVFRIAGTYWYHWSIHLDMTGIVIVTG